LAAIATWVNDMGAIGSDIQRSLAGSVSREAIANWTRAGAFVLLLLSVNRVDSAARKSHSRHDFHELRGVLTDDGDVLQDVFVDKRGFLAGIGRSDLDTARFHDHGLFRP